MPAKLTGQRLGCLVLVAAALGLARLRVALSHQSTLAIVLTQNHTGMSGHSAAVATISPRWLRDLAWAINVVSQRLPYRANCLVRVLAAQQILSHRAPFEIHVSAGLRNNRFAAHTWLICQGVPLTGGPVQGLERLQRAEQRS